MERVLDGEKLQFINEVRLGSASRMETVRRKGRHGTARLLTSHNTLAFWTEIADTGWMDSLLRAYRLDALTFPSDRCGVPGNT